MNQIQRNAFLANIKDPGFRKVAEEHPDCLHPCVWLVKDENGPLEAGGKPQLPVGREWPRADGKLLTYLLSIDTSLLPEWSPLPRNSGKLLLFVGHNTCEIVIAAPGVKTHETEPPLEDYVAGELTAGEVLESTRFGLEAGLHAGMPASWSPTDDEATTWDADLEEALRKLNNVLRPENSFGRLFGHHDWWVDADPAAITKYSYLDVNGYRGGWYQRLDGSVEKLRRQLESAKSQTPLENEQLPMMADSVVRACEKWVAVAERKVEERRGILEADTRKRVEEARSSLARRRKRWHDVRTTGPEAANRALEELIDSASQIDRDMEHTPNTNDPEEFETQRKDMEERDAEEKLEWSRRAMANLKEEARIRRENVHDPEALEAAMKIFQESRGKGKTAYSELLTLLTSMQYACQKNDCDVIRKAWSDYEHKLNECASQLEASQLSTALHWRLEGYEILVGWSRQGRIDPKAVARKIEAIQWWQADVQKHEAQLAYWRPLLVMDSDGGPYFWGDAGWAIILADQRKVAEARLGRLAIAVDVS